MNFLDIIALAWRNLRQSKLRTALTVIGVIVGVAAIVTLVSLGLGLQQNILGQALSKLDVFTLISVRGANVDALLELNEGRTLLDGGEGVNKEKANGAGDAAGANGNESGNSNEGTQNDGNQKPFPRLPRRVLNDETIAEIQKLKGVKYALPMVSFGTFVRFNDRVKYIWIGGAPAHVEDISRFNVFLAGHPFSSDDAREVIIDEDFLALFSAKWYQDRRAGKPRNDGPWRKGPTKSEAERAADAQQVIGKDLVLLTPHSNEDAPTSIFGIPILAQPETEIEPGPDAENDRRFEQHRFRIVGVLPSEEGFRVTPLANARMIVPLEVAKHFQQTNRNPIERIGEALAGDTGYQLAEVRVSTPMQVKPTMDQIDKMGFRTFSINNQLEEINRIFLIVNSTLALIGGIALLVATFGISNTMIMSIRERTREIGIMKAIGGSDGEIMRIFFVEASLIGLTGGTLGVIGGWAIDRVANRMANQWIIKQAAQTIRHIEFFSIPWYLAGGAILFALLVSLVAAIYPALSAARVDPIKALRYE